MKNDRIAAKVLAVKDVHNGQTLWVIGGLRGPGGHPLGITMGQVRALAKGGIKKKRRKK